MGKDIEGELRKLRHSERTLFYALRRRFGTRLGIPDAVHLRAVKCAVVPEPYGPGKPIVRVGDCHDAFMFLAAGMVKVVCIGANGKKVTVQMVNDGHAFALPSLAGASEPRQFGAVAHSQAQVGILSPSALRDIFAKLDCERWLRLLTYGWNANLGLLFERRLLLSLSVADRLWYILWRLSRRFPAPAAAPGTIAVRLTQTDLAEMIGAGRSTVCRALAVLVSDERVSIRRGRYVVHEPPPFSAMEDSPDGELAAAASCLQDEASRRDLFRRLQEGAGRMGLPSKAIDAFVANARLAIFPANAPIELVDGSDALTLLLSGAARVECSGPTGEPLALAFLKPGQLVIGKGGSLHHSVGFRAKAHVESCAAILTREGLLSVLSAMSPAHMVHFLSFGWRALSHHQLNQCLYLTMNDKDRVLHQLIQLATDFPAPHQAGTIIDLPLTRADIGSLVEAAENTVGRCFRRLEAERRIAFVDGSTRRILVVGLFLRHRAA